MVFENWEGEPFSDWDQDEIKRQVGEVYGPTIEAAKALVYRCQVALSTAGYHAVEIKADALVRAIKELDAK